MNKDLNNHFFYFMHYLLRIKWIYVLLISVCILFTSTCTTEPTIITPSQKVTLQLKWYHQAQFAGFYAAEENHYFTERNLSVTMVEGGPYTDVIDEVVSNRSQFAIASPEQVIIARDQGFPIVAIAAIYQRSPVVFVSLKTSGITRPEDCIGNVIQSPNDIKTTFIATMEKMNISSDQYTLVNIGSDLNDLYNGNVDVWVTYILNRPYQIEMDGYDMNIIYPDDYGIHGYGDILITTEKYIQDNQQIVEDFVSAVVRGWQWSLENINDAAEMTLPYQPDGDIHFQTQFLEKSFPLIFTGHSLFGWMDEDVWEGIINELYQQQIITQQIEPEIVFTNQFVERAQYEQSNEDHN